MVATRSELAVRRWSIVSDELIEQLRLLPFGAGETAGGVIIGTTPVDKTPESRTKVALPELSASSIIDHWLRLRTVIVQSITARQGKSHSTL